MLKLNSKLLVSVFVLAPPKFENNEVFLSMKSNNGFFPSELKIESFANNEVPVF